ncbi:MAG: hypothetical protein O3B01_31590 [Planctomycetota bacterium]|nr:hypothetical protein [Planctomycetota bacterium]MDA1143127.1 hypothetical protein [Planctomycetota bacterium]
MKDARINTNTGRLDAGKGRTEREHFDLVEDIAPDLPALLRKALQAGDAGRPGIDESHCDGKHGRVQE